MKHYIKQKLFLPDRSFFHEIFKHVKQDCLCSRSHGMIYLPLQGQVTPGSGNGGATNTPPSGNYPGSGSSPQPGVPPPSLAPSGPTPGSGNNGARHTPSQAIIRVQVPRRNRVFHRHRMPFGTTPGSGNNGASIPRRMVSRPDLAPLPIPQIRVC